MQGNPLTAEEKELFLIKLRSFKGNISKAARSIKRSRSALYEQKKEDTEFGDAWEEIIESLIDDAEGELYRRAVKGVIKKHYYKGVEIAKFKEYSDTLLMFWLKGKRPEVYRERFDIDTNISGSLDVSIEKAIDKIYGDDSET